MILLALGVIRRSRIELVRQNLAGDVETPGNGIAQFPQDCAIQLSDRQQVYQIHRSTLIAALLLFDVSQRHRASTGVRLQP